MVILWHWTCEHGALGIRRDRAIHPSRHPLLPEPLVWLSDLDTAPREALGLTSHVLKCDRMAHRFRVDTSTAEEWCAERWCTYAHWLRRAVREALESAPGALPAHWWVSAEPIPINPEEPVT